MAAKITTNCVEAYLRCKTKAHLKALGEQGSISDYELLLAEMKSETKRTMIEWALSHHEKGTFLQDVTATAALLRQGATFVLGASIEDENFSLALDGLKREPGESRLGEFHYIPVLFHSGEKARLEERLLLAILGIVLGDLQGRQPRVGMVYLGLGGRGVRIQLGEAVRERAKRILREIKNLLAQGTPPRLMLNRHCQVCEFQGRCLEQAVKGDDLSLLRGMGEKEILKLNRKGIFTIAQLACTFRLRKKGKRVRRQKQPHYFALQAVAIRDKKIYLLKPSALPARPVRIYLDFEGNADRGFVYLVGMLIVENGSESWHSFWADGKDDEQTIFGQMLDVLGKYDDFTIVHYGSYETSFLKRMQRTFGRKASITKILAQSINLLSLIYSHIYFPVHSNSLKTIGAYLGCTWTDPAASGLRSIVLRERWEKSRDGTLKRDLETYNKEDCLALKRVADLVYLIGDANTGESGSTPCNYGGCTVASAGDINPIMSRPEFRRPNFALPDLEFVNKCAYFDYQREKVFLRTSSIIRRANTRKKKDRRTTNPRINRTIEVRSRNCPHCGDTSLVRYANKMHSKLAYDLVVSESGVRRQIISCEAAVHRCRACSKTFLPPKYKRRDKHFHSLKSWAMYHHIAHRISFENLETMISDCFGIQVDHVEIHQFKFLLAKYYRVTYQRILSTDFPHISR